MHHLLKAAKLFNREEFADRLDLPTPERKLLTKIPPRYLAISSEADGAEAKLWDYMEHFFGEDIFSIACDKVETVKMLGTKAFVWGEMTWTIFVAPEDIEKILATVCFEEPQS